MLDKKAVREVALKYADKVLQEFNPDKIILFGSYVDGTPHEWSDIDIAVVIHSFKGEWLKLLRGCTV